MPSIECSADAPADQSQDKTLSRRQLLKALTISGGQLTALALLPDRWSKPAIEVSKLPIHAQTSPGRPTATPSIVAIIGCFTFNASGGGNIGATDMLQTFADVAPARGGVQLRRTISLNQAGHPQDGVVALDSGSTNDAGRFQPPDFDLAPLSDQVSLSPGVGRLTILWEFVNPADGSNACQNNVDIV